jgi:acyl-CoA synthetase (NDP forming)
VINSADYRKSVRAMSRLRKNERDRAIGRFLPATRLAAQPNLPSLSSGVVSYADTDRLLQSYGIALAPAVMAQSAGEAVNDVDKLGYPCVLKVASIDIPHKTEFDALRLGLASRDAVEKAYYEEMLASVRVKKPDAHIRRRVGAKANQRCRVSPRHFPRRATRADAGDGSRRCIRRYPSRRAD